MFGARISLLPFCLPLHSTQPCLLSSVLSVIGPLSKWLQDRQPVFRALIWARESNTASSLCVYLSLLSLLSPIRDRASSGFCGGARARGIQGQCPRGPVRSGQEGLFWLPFDSRALSVLPLPPPSLTAPFCPSLPLQTLRILSPQQSSHVCPRHPHPLWPLPCCHRRSGRNLPSFKDYLGSSSHVLPLYPSICCTLPTHPPSAGLPSSASSFPLFSIYPTPSLISSFHSLLPSSPLLRTSREWKTTVLRELPQLQTPESRCKNVCADMRWHLGRA